MEVKLSKRDVLKLINLYHSYPLLWDLKNKFYRNKNLRNKAFEFIAKEMGMMVELVKRKIRNLRTTYTNEKRKMYLKKSSSGGEEQYISTLPWYTEMSFLDNSIIVRKPMDDSAEDDLNSESYEEIEECGFAEHKNNTPSKRPREATAKESFEEIEECGFAEYENNTPSKRPRKATATESFDEIEECEFEEYSENKTHSKRPRKATATATDKIDKVLEKILNENEFTAFGESIAQQLVNMPKEPAYELMDEIQSLICKKKMKGIRKNRFRPLAVKSESSSSSNNICSSTPPSNISSLEKKSQQADPLR